MFSRPQKKNFSLEKKNSARFLTLKITLIFFKFSFNGWENFAIFLEPIIMLKKKFSLDFNN